MNKKLIALAVAGACVAPEAMAQTANPVVLYGRVNATLESVEGTGSPAGTLPRRMRVSDQASRFGIRGTEDLGGGLSAFFQLEAAFKIDQNDTTFANRNSAVGLQGGWGSFLIGRWDTPLKVAANSIDPWGDVTWGGQAISTLGSGVGGNNAHFDIREQNVAQYWTPNWGGLAARLSYAANEGRNTTVNPRSEGASLTYTRGPLFLGYGYHELKDYAAYGTSPATTGPLASGTAIGNKQALNALMGTFTFGPVKVGGMYHKIKRTGFGATSYDDQKSWVANITWTMGNNELIWQHGDNKAGGVSGTAQPSCKNDSVGWRYNFSKRTTAYLQYAKIDNNDTGTCNSGTYPGPLTTRIAGQDIKAMQFGMAMNF